MADNLFGAGWVKSAVGAAAILIVIMLVSSQSNTPETATTGDSDRGTMKAHNTVCRTKAATEREIELSSDVEAFGRFVLDPTNGCTELPAGTPVIVDEVSIGLRRFHVRGDPQSYWTIKESILDVQ